MTNLPLKALIFDVGDILYDASLWRRSIADYLVSNGVDTDYERFVEAWEKVLIRVYKGKANYWRCFTQLMSDFRMPAAHIDEILRFAKQKAMEVQELHEPMPGVADTLGKLRERGITLVALSDTESGEAGVRRKLSQLGLEQYLTAVVSSRDVGFVKPEPEAFEIAIAATGVPKESCGFVAHDVDELSGAMAIELFAVGYNYHCDAPADMFIEKFSELLALV